MHNALTIIRSINPGNLGKSFHLDAKGAIQKSTVGAILEGACQSYEVADAGAMVNTLLDITNRQDSAIMPGTFLNDPKEEFRLVSEAAFIREIGKLHLGVHTKPDGNKLAARKKDGITPSTWILLDFDEPPGFPQDWKLLNIDERLQLMERVIPGISKCERIDLYSSSARVILPGNSPRQKTHSWIQISDASKVEMLRIHTQIHSVLKGISFIFNKHSTKNPSLVVAKEHRTLIDAAVFVTGRLVFCSKPNVDIEGARVIDANPEVINPGAGLLDLSWLKEPSKEDLASYKKYSGMSLQIVSKGTGLAFIARGALNLNTEIKAGGKTQSTEQWIADMRAGVYGKQEQDGSFKLRCETPFRESFSEAAFIKMSKDGDVMLFDVGTSTTYPLLAFNKIDVEDSLPLPPKRSNSWLNRITDMKTTEELMNSIQDTQFAWKRLIPQGHMVIICARAGDGKTTIMIQAAAEMAADGYEVIYINADASADQLKDYHRHATENNYTLVAPDLHVGKSVNDVVEALGNLAKTAEDLSDKVLILDTVKKFTDMIQKQKAKEFFRILRSLTTKGMTIVSLGHTNKYNDADGKPIYEGTGDVRNDFDDLIYFVAVKNDEGNLLVSTTLDKRRAAGMRDETFEIDSETRHVSVKSNYVDTLEIANMKKSIEKDSDVIQFIQDSIRFQNRSIEEVCREAKDGRMDFSKGTIRRVMKNYSSSLCTKPLWRSIAVAGNGFRYGQLLTDD